MNLADLQTWLAARLPAELQAAPPDIRPYDEELVIVLQVPAPPTAEDNRQAGEFDAIADTRERTRGLRMRLARELQGTIGTPVAWGVRCGNSEALFTTRSAPVMTRLGRAERDVLDTLVAAGVAETRSAALAYVVRAFAVEHSEWLREMREALVQINAVRSKLQITPRPGPPADPPQGE